MKIKIIRLIGLVVMINLMVSGASAQEYVDEEFIFFSSELKAGMEFTWEIERFSFTFNESETNLELDQVTSSSVVQETSTETQVLTSTTTAETTITEVTTVDETTSTDSGGPELPEIAPGTEYNVKLLKDMGDLSQYDYWENRDDLDGVYWEDEYSDPDMDEDFFGFDFWIYPAEIRFENGTEKNYFEYQVELFRMEVEENPDEDKFGEFYIEEGIAIQSIDFTEAGNKVKGDIRYDISTGVLLYLSIIQHDEEISLDALMKLKHSEGINIDTIVGNEDPTLSVPFSIISVYTIILTPVVVNRFRKRS